jgi:tetratricopeptide (TPR) repeat protein
MSNLQTIKDSGIIEIDMLDGLILFNEGEYAKAFKIFDALSSKNLRQPGIHLQLAMIYIQMDEFEKAIASLHTELKIDDNNTLAHYHLGLALLNTGSFKEAANSFLDCIGLNYSFPAAHYYLGLALSKMNSQKDAISALSVFLSLAPSNLNARILLSKLLKNTEPEIAKNFSKQIIDMKKGEVIIVSGLPRSGTSMMMQILDAAGLDILTDKIRNADENNPKGYYEFEPVKSLARDSSWFNQADGKVVKVIAQLLKFLPDGYTYKVIFMKRNINEVLTSQQKMLGKDSKNFPLALAETFKKELSRIENWFQIQPNFEVIYADYGDLVSNPNSAVDEICNFLNIEPEKKENMVRVVDRSLHRNKS